MNNLHRHIFSKEKKNFVAVFLGTELRAKPDAHGTQKNGGNLQLLFKKIAFVQKKMTSLFFWLIFHSLRIQSKKIKGIKSCRFFLYSEHFGIFSCFFLHNFLNRTGDFYLQSCLQNI